MATMTDAGRELLDALETATRAAQKVNTERGWINGAGDGIGYAESLKMMALQLRGEIEGPKGRD